MQSGEGRRLYALKEEDNMINRSTAPSSLGETMGLESTYYSRQSNLVVGQNMMCSLASSPDISLNNGSICKNFQEWLMELSSDQNCTLSHWLFMS